MNAFDNKTVGGLEIKGLQLVSFDGMPRMVGMIGVSVYSWFPDGRFMWNEPSDMDVALKEIKE